jgi:heavy metal sensor kinase
MPESLKALAFSPGEAREVQAGGVTYLMLDTVDTEESDGLFVRVCMPLDAVERALKSVRTISLIGGPLLLVAAALLGLIVARRSLKPIEKIISSARVVAAGNLGERIASAPSRDEVGALTDILNEMLDQLEESFKREKRFASDASHELRMPVSVIMAYAEALVSEDTLGPEDRASVQTILDETQRMRRMIAQLLTITRGDEGCYPSAMESVDLAEVAGAVCDQAKEMADGKNMAIVFDAGHAPIVGDQSLITQMTLNLVENAVKYGLAGGRISVGTGSADGMSRLVVADDGPGIAPEHLPHIFERFYRADAARDRSGSGLGLSIVRWIVDLHHGTIEVASSPAGTRFVISIPTVNP